MSKSEFKHNELDAKTFILNIDYIRQSFIHRISQFLYLPSFLLFVPPPSLTHSFVFTLFSLIHLSSPFSHSFICSSSFSHSFICSSSFSHSFICSSSFSHSFICSSSLPHSFICSSSFSHSFICSSSFSHSFICLPSTRADLPPIITHPTYSPIHFFMPFFSTSFSYSFESPLIN